MELKGQYAVDGQGCGPTVSKVQRVFICCECRQCEKPAVRAASWLHLSTCSVCHCHLLHNATHQINGQSHFEVIYGVALSFSQEN